MNKKEAAIIAEKITNEELSIMFENAKNNIFDWTKVSIVNKGLTKGVAWNILAKYFDLSKEYHILAKRNMVREFGDFLPENVKNYIPEKPKRNKILPTHQEPDFN